MKILRLLIAVVIAVLIFSVWTPAPVYASAPTTDLGQTVVLAGAKTGSITVDNRTGGTMRVVMSGPKHYYFLAPKQGKTTFKNIEYGTYSITLSTTACNGSLTYTKKVKGNVNMKPVVCVRH